MARRIATNPRTGRSALPVVLVGFLLAAGNLRAQTTPTIESDQGEIAGVGSTVRFLAKGGSTASPPKTVGRPPWMRTGRKLYTWHITLTESEDGPEERHEFDGTVTSGNSIEIKMDKPGDYSISVSLREEWVDANNFAVFWPDPTLVIPPAPTPTPPWWLMVPWLPGAPFVPGAN